PSDRKKGHIPRRVDPDTTWGRSAYDGWVQGYSFEVVVSAKGEVTWPLLASVDTASRSEQKTFLEKVEELSPATRYVLADSGYDGGAGAARVEDRGTTRPLLAREAPRPNARRPRQPQSRQSSERQQHRLREKRRAFLQSRRGRKLYGRRKTRVEPFHAQF